MLAVTFETFRQLTVDGFFRGCSYGLLGVGFALILGVTGRFHFAYGFTYTLAAYLAFTFTFQMWEWPFWPSAIIGILLAGRASGRGSSAACTARSPATPGPPRCWRCSSPPSASASPARTSSGSTSAPTPRPTSGRARRRHVIWDAIYINFDWWQAASAIAITLALAAMLRYTGLGRQIKATRVNPDLAKTIGIDADRVYVIVFFLGTICAGVAAFWYALKYTVDPAMGTLPITYAFVVAFLGGTARSPIRVFLMGIVVALIEQYASIWLSVQYTQTAVFVVLVGYLTYLAIRSSAFMAKFKKERPATPLVPATAGEG